MEFVIWVNEREFVISVHRYEIRLFREIQQKLYFNG